MRRKYVIFGSQGLIGSSLVRQIAPVASDTDILHPTREDILNPEISLATSGHPDDAYSVFYCHGPTNTRLDLDTHKRFHVDLPRRWLELFENNTDLKAFVTLGSVHETETTLTEKNNYLIAKRMWREIHENAGAHSVHVQLHTLYGNPVRPHSFIGQMFAALRAHSDFQMSLGTQLREYHHVDDITETLAKLGDPAFLVMAGKNPILSHGNPISLKELASGVFEYFGASHHLKLGAVPRPDGEIISMHWPAFPSQMEMKYRPTVQGVIQLFKDEGLKR